MTQQEIDKAVNDWTDGFGGSTVEIAQRKKDVAAISYRAGANFVNERQPYSREDMIKMGKLCFNIGCAIGHYPAVDPDYNEIIKRWEETK